MKLSFTSKMCLTAIVAIGLVSSMSATGAMAQSSPKPVFHKAPLLPGEFAMLSLGSVKPGGWLKRELQIQADGITGHMDEFYHLLTTNGWLGQEGPKFNSYQWAPYYLDGLVPLAHLLDDKRLKDKAAKWINWTLDNPHKDGWIGPPAEVCNRPWGMWYPTPMLKALVQHFEATGDKRVIPVLTNFFKAYTKRMNPVNGQTLLENSDHEITVTYFEKGGDEGLEVLWDGPEIERQRIPDASLKDLQYEYYEGSWSKLPDFDNLKVVDSGSAKNFDIASIYKKNKKDAKPDNFAIRFSGKIAIRENGWYTFYLISDAGSQLSVKSQLVVDNDGLHPMDRGGLKPEWAFNRWGDVAYVAMWLYDRTSDETLIDLVKAIRDNGRNWSESFTTFEGMENAAKAWGHHQHGVNTAMGVKTPGISYLMTKDKYDLDAITRCFENLDKYHGTPVGIFTAEECLSGRGPDKGCELCLVIDEMFSIELLMSVVGDWRLADRLEKITYNAWPATVGPKQWTHQYFQRVNQVACEKKDSSFIFGPLTHFPCCTTNLPQGWPKFAANTWMATPDGGLVAVVYAPSEVTSIVAGDKEVKIVETTEYPFDENIKFTISTKAPVEFPLYVRIPGWCDAAEITEPDGKTTSPKAGQYLKIARTWKNGDIVKVTLPMKARLDKRQNNAVAIQRGPLVYSLKMGEDWRKVKDWPDFKAKTAQCADWAIYPTTPWNYALQLDPDNLENSLKFEKVGIKDYIFDSTMAPVKLTVKGRRLPEWKLTNHDAQTPQRKLKQPNRAGLPPKSPVQSTEPLEDLTLIPYGAAKLRITVFPVLGASCAAAEAKTGVNLAPVAEPSTSHVSRDTSLAALHDGHAPKTSHVRGKGSYGNWPSKRTQWVQYDWTAPVRTRKIDVFWWDDRAGVRLPKACRLLYWDGKRFVPVRNPSGLGVAKDRFNTTTFDEVLTSRLRLEIDGNGDYSTGILEWKVYNEGELPNFPPSVKAGADRIVMLGRKTPFAGQLLRAISTATTKVTWSKSSGPGKVVFADPTALATTATFSAVGDYVLTLTARKGKMSDSSTLAVRVVGRPQLDIRAAGKTGIRITIQPQDSKDKFPYTPALVERDYPKAVISLRELDSAFESVKARVGQMNVTVQSKPLSVLVTTLDNKPLQKITFAPDGTMSFDLDDQPVLGMGEGGPKQIGDSWRTDKIELDRRGRLHPMTPWYGTGTYGSYNPVPLMVGTAGWGLFIPTPWGAIDLSDSETGKFIPADPIEPGTVVSRRQQRTGRIGMPPPEYFIPGTYDVFVFDAQNPAAFMKDISTLSGQAVLPPKWVMGYQQSHRTLKDETQMLQVVDTFREKQIPLDSVCYLGTGFCPSGWNKSQPSFEFNPGVFKRDPKEVLADMHDRNVRVMMHMIPWDRDRLATIQGTVPPKPGERLDNTHIQNYWNEHNALVDAGVDAWWPDEGDWFNFHERMKRHELYYTGPLSKQPNVRPWSLHRNGYLGVARWGGWMWPGDPLTTWRTLETHIAIGINHSLSVSPFWNSDIGAFYTTDEYSAELYVRWVQFAAFNSLMRAHGRGWENRLPWAWGQSEPGTGEGSYTPPKSALNNPTVEPIAKKYIELRYQLLSYNYTLTWEARETGMPMMRSLWLHYPKDKQARGIGDEYLWGRDMLIAPVYEKDAMSREVYLPAGTWYDWWTRKAVEGGKAITRQVDLSCMPIYVRAGAIIPFDPVRQYTSQKVAKPTTLKIYRGADGQFTLYDDDGVSLDYLKGSSIKTRIKWDDTAKRLTLEPTTKQKTERKFKIELIPDGVTKEIPYTGQRVELKF